MAQRDENEVLVETAAAPGMDINRFLAKNPKDKSLGDMFRVLHRGKIKTEAEWSTEVDSVINRRIN